VSGEREFILECHPERSEGADIGTAEKLAVSNSFGSLASLGMTYLFNPFGRHGLPVQLAALESRLAGAWSRALLIAAAKRTGVNGF
jgi:hypothetical protein